MLFQTPTLPDTTRPLHERRKAFLDEMVAFYGENPVKRRASKMTKNGDGESCLYRFQQEGDAEVRKCAIGRYISDKDYSPDQENNSCDEHIVVVSLPAEVQALGREFLQQVQSLHDDRRYWLAIGLSTNGQTRYNHIVNRFCTLAINENPTY